MIVGPEVGSENGGNKPVFFGPESADFPLFFDNHLDGDGLDPAGGQPPGDFLPQQRAYLIADYAVEDSPGLLCHNFVHIDFFRFGKGTLYCRFGYSIENHAVGFCFRHAEDLCQVPGDCFAFTVEVGGQIEVPAFFRSGP